MLSNQGRSDLAGPFVSELVYNAYSWKNPTAIAEAMIQRGRIALDRGQQDAADSDLQIASAALQQIPQGKIREIIGYRLDGEMAIAKAELKPQEAVEGLSAAIERQALLGNSFDHLRLLTARAKSLINLERWLQAEKRSRRSH